MSTMKLGDMKRIINAMDLPDDTMVYGDFDFTSYPQEVNSIETNYIDDKSSLWYYNEEDDEKIPEDELVKVVCIFVGN